LASEGKAKGWPLLLVLQSKGFSIVAESVMKRGMTSDNKSPARETRSTIGKGIERSKRLYLPATFP
jgi:hypothetical protein